MKLLKLTDQLGIPLLANLSGAATIKRRSNNSTLTDITWVERHLFLCVLESPEEIAAMLAEEPPQKSPLEAAAPELLAALKTILPLYKEAECSNPDHLVRMLALSGGLAAIARAEGRA